MNLARLLGIAIAAAGIVFLIAGLNATDAPVERLSETFTGKYTQETIMYIAGGLAAIVAGIVVAVTASRQ
jgi:hypothetical protein